MEDVFSLKYGVAGICVLLTLLIFQKVGEFLWSIKKEKDSVSEESINKLTRAVEQSTIATRHLEQRLEHLEDTVSELPKFKNDIRRFYAAMKEVAGDRWPKIREEIMKDEFTL